MRRIALLTALTALAAVWCSPPVGSATLERGGLLCGSYAGRRHLEKAIHRFVEQQISRSRRLSAAPARAEALGDIVLVEADGSVVSGPNPFDLKGVATAFTPTGDPGRYRLSIDPEPLEVALGDPIGLGDDDTREIDLPFPFEFFGSRMERVFLNSDGNLTFLAPDNASTERSLERFLTGPPRIALFFADLDPSQGGTVRVARLPERLVVTWDSVPEFDKTNQSTFQVVLEDDGRIVFRHGSAIDAGSAVVGISPGGGPRDIQLVDLSEAANDAPGAIVEKFQRGLLINNLGLVRTFFRSFPDVYDSIVLWTTFNSDLDGAFAFEVTAQNAVRGIGEDVFNDTALWGSAGRLATFVFMGNIARYPASPDQPVLRAGGRPSILGLLAHEFGHRWLARVRFEEDGRASSELLGRQQAHWSFFMDTDASFLEGNDILEESEGSFRTVETLSRYSSLDLYLMGMAPPAEVAPLFIVDEATGTTPFGEPVTHETSPAQNVTLRGARRGIQLEDILRWEGPRRPDFEASQKEFRQAWILLYRSGDPLASDAIPRIDDIRRAWEVFFHTMTLGRARVRTSIE